jgi:ATP-dependent exoDNAse (exonuclease V) beta subunit
MKPKDYNPDNPKNKTEEQKGQELNTFYVASTRAAKSMYISSDDEP